MAVNDFYEESDSSLSDGDDLIIDGSSAETDAAEISVLAGTGDCEVYEETYDGSSWSGPEIDSPTGDWHSQINQIRVKDGEHRIRITNVSGDSITAFATGWEVSG